MTQPETPRSYSPYHVGFAALGCLASGATRTEMEAVVVPAMMRQHGIAEEHARALLDEVLAEAGYDSERGFFADALAEAGHGPATTAPIHDAGRLLSAFAFAYVTTVTSRRARMTALAERHRERSSAMGLPVPRPPRRRFAVIPGDREG